MRLPTLRLALDPARLCGLRRTCRDRSDSDHVVAASVELSPQVLASSQSRFSSNTLLESWPLLDDLGEPDGAHARIRTGDLLLTKEMLCHLSYVGGAPTDFICYILNARFMPTIADLLEAARSRYSRVTPQQAAAEQCGGALLIGTRSPASRSSGGELAGAAVSD